MNLFALESSFSTMMIEVYEPVCDSDGKDILADYEIPDFEHMDNDADILTELGEHVLCGDVIELDSSSKNSLGLEEGFIATLLEWTSDSGSEYAAECGWGYGGIYRMSLGLVGETDDRWGASVRRYGVCVYLGSPDSKYIDASGALLPEAEETLASEMLGALRFGFSEYLSS